MKIRTYCSACDTWHDLKVIRILSNFKKSKIVVWCNNKWKLYTLWMNK